MKIKKGNVEAEILPKGAYLYSFKINGKELILRGNLERVTRGGMAVLIPFANRIKGGEYIFEGTRYVLPKNNEGNAIHGLVLDKEFEVLEVQSDSVSLKYELEHEGYPTRLACILVYKLFRNGFRVKINVKNIGNKRSPLTVGLHPYFIVAEDWKIEVKDNVKRCVTFNKIPTGELVKTKIEHREYDDCFFVNDSIVLKSSYSVVKLVRRNMPYIQLYTGVRGALAIEPMSGAPDAYHNGLGLRIIEPNEEVNYSFSAKFLQY